MRTRRSTGIGRAAVVGLAAAVLSACASPHSTTDELLERNVPAEQNAPLGGASLSQHKQEMRRAYRDLVRFHSTLETLHYRGDSNGLVLMREFVEGYLDEHLEPMLAREWQSSHAELLGLDANLRLMQADVLMLMRDPQGMQRVVDEIRRRYQGHEAMLVEYPVGQQSTLEEALEALADRKWWG